MAHTVVIALAGQIRDLEARIGELETEPREPSRGNGAVRRLQTILGIGPITASAPAAAVTDPRQFKSAHQFAAWLGLTPRAESSDGKERMGRISKMGDRYLWRLLVIGMTSQLQAARIAWVIMTREEIYCAPQTRNGANPMTN